MHGCCFRSRAERLGQAAKSAETSGKRAWSLRKGLHKLWQLREVVTLGDSPSGEAKRCTQTGSACLRFCYQLAPVDGVCSQMQVAVHRHESSFVQWHKHQGNSVYQASHLIVCLSCMPGQAWTECGCNASV